MTRWECKVIETSLSSYENFHVQEWDAISNLGATGWELVSVVCGDNDAKQWLWFKRPLPE